MAEIKLDTTIAELLNSYDGMKDILIDINPKFKKLNNPILRRTLAKIATVKQAAIIGGMEPIDLVNKLRVAVGQEPIGSSIKFTDSIKEPEPEPDWIDKKPTVVIDANRLLDEDKNPLAEVNLALKKLSSMESLVIESDFRPEPLIDEFRSKGYSVYTKELSSSIFKTYIRV